MSTSDISQKIATLEPQLKIVKKFRASCTEITNLLQSSATTSSSTAAASASAPVSDQASSSDQPPLDPSSSSSSSNSQQNQISISDLELFCNAATTIRKTLQAKVSASGSQSSKELWALGLDYFLILQGILEGVLESEDLFKDSEDVAKKLKNFNTTELQKAIDLAIQESEVSEQILNEKKAPKASQPSTAGQQPQIPPQLAPFLSALGLQDTVLDSQSILQQMQQLEQEYEANTNNSKRIHHKARHELRVVRVGLDTNGTIDNNNDKEIAKNSKDLTCPICLEPMPLGSKAKKMPQCGHLFHDECIMKCLEENKSCPLCRGDFLEGRKVWTRVDERDVEGLGENSKGGGVYS